MRTYIALLFISIFTIANNAVAQKKPVVKKEIDPTDMIAANTIEALQKNDTNIIIQKLMPTQANFDKLFNAIYIDNIELVKLMNTVKSRETLQAKLIKSFKKLVMEGERQGINWQTIKMSSHSKKVSQKKAATAFSVPIKFTSAGKEYSIIIEFGNWLNEDPKIFVLGEFLWNDSALK